MRARTRVPAVPARTRRCRLSAFALSVAAALSTVHPAFAQEEAPACPNPPPVIAGGGLMRDGEVATAVHRIATVAADERRQGRLVSLAIGIVHDQTLLLAAGFGCANLERGIPATPDTVYRIGSVTKVFEATALMQLRDAGRLRLDDAIDRYVPEAWYPGPGGGRVSPTWRQLASHTAGLQRNVQPNLGTVPDLFRFLEHRTAAAEPGKVYAYSNLGFVVLGQAAALVAGERYHDYVRRHIFAPLGTPLVAVADGSLFNVGWNDVGGNRLWLRDGAGNEFYYAHLSAYSPLAREGAQVRAGDTLRPFFSKPHG